MIRRLYIHNFRCLENFELIAAGKPSVMLIGKNGTGKSTVSFALELLQKIGRGTNRAKELLPIKDVSNGRTDVPVRFELEVEIKGAVYHYGIAFELPPGFKELRVLDEKLLCNGQTIFSRAIAEVTLHRANKEVPFAVDWHVAALPVIQEQSKTDPLYILRTWLAKMLILRPIPALISGESDSETLEPAPQLTNLASWFSGIVAHEPGTYATIDSFLKELTPDFKDIKNPTVGRESRSLMVRFTNDLGILEVPFQDVSDGEKCFLICALVLASVKSLGPVFCFWDEPDNYLAPSEVGHFVTDLRRAFEKGGQFIATSHNPEAILQFSENNTFLLTRKNHLEPTIIRPLSDIQHSGDLVGDLLRGDLGD